MLTITGTQLQQWANTNEPAETLIFRGGYWSQILFIRDEVAKILASTYEEFQAIQDATLVISTHISKSVLLPVFLISLPDGTQFVLRCNFYDWKVSVISPRAVEADFMGLFDTTATVNPLYCEGFPRDLVFGSYDQDKRHFTVEFPAGYYHLFTFFYIYSHVVLGNRNKGGMGR